MMSTSSPTSPIVSRSTAPIPPEGDPEIERPDSENDDEEEDEEEDEPQLKYERVTGDIARVIRGDLVSAFAVGTKYIVRSPPV
jgi:hypothetical protein